MVNRRSFAALLLALTAGISAAAQSATTAESPEALARTLQQHYSKIQDFKASFEQTSRGGVLKVPSAKGEGTVVVKKPGRMRWDYTKPEPQQIVSDGSRMYSCVLDNKKWNCEAPVAMPRDDEAPSATLFLLGRGDILRDFRVSRVQGPIPNALALRLEPKKPDPDYAFLVIAFDPTTYQIRGLVTRNNDGSESTIVFNNIKVNTNISDKTFTPPRNATK
jgi:outer membrane lipoprotein carrier protein